MTGVIAEDRHLAVSLPAHVADALDVIAARHGATVQEMIRRLSVHLPGIAAVLPPSAFRLTRNETVE